MADRVARHPAAPFDVIDNRHVDPSDRKPPAIRDRSTEALERGQRERRADKLALRQLAPDPLIELDRRERRLAVVARERLLPQRASAFIDFAADLFSRIPGLNGTSIG